MAAENVEYQANLQVKEELLTQAQALLPVTDIEATKAALRAIQDKWEAAGKVPRGDLERLREGHAPGGADGPRGGREALGQPQPRGGRPGAEVLVDQLESAVEDLRADLAAAEASGNERRTADARAALEAREQWLAQARAGLQEFSS